MIMVKKIGKFVMLSIALTCSAIHANAQEVALKTNLLYDALSTVNAGVEIRLAPKWTLDVSGNYNNWRVSGQSWKNWMVQPEARYWFCNTMAGHFVAVNAIGGRFNFGHLKHTVDFLNNDFSKLKDHRRQGLGLGAGIAYGYAWILGKHWNLEGELGIGWIWTRYDEFECKGCGRKIAEDRVHNYVGPTKAALNLVYIF